MSDPLTRESLEAAALRQGASLFGVADLATLLQQEPALLSGVPNPGFTRAVVLGVRLQEAVLADLVDKPTPLYFHNYRQANYRLDSLAQIVADLLQRDGFLALAIPASQVITRDPMRGHISHKRLGVASGLGFIGRNNLLINPTYGARVRYVSILTDRPFQPDSPIAGSCGSCRSCITRCPANAIGETATEFQLDACYAKLTEFTRLSFIGQHICGVCVKACAGTRSCVQPDGRPAHGRHS